MVNHRRVTFEPHEGVSIWAESGTISRYSTGHKKGQILLALAVRAAYARVHRCGGRDYVALSDWRIGAFGDPRLSLNGLTDFDSWHCRVNVTVFVPFKNCSMGEMENKMNGMKTGDKKYPMEEICRLKRCLEWFRVRLLGLKERASRKLCWGTYSRAIAYSLTQCLYYSPECGGGGRRGGDCLEQSILSSWVTDS